jgi:hypothetical protein
LRRSPADLIEDCSDAALHGGDLLGQLAAGGGSAGSILRGRTGYPKAGEQDVGEHPHVIAADAHRHQVGALVDGLDLGGWHRTGSAENVLRGRADATHVHQPIAQFLCHE